MDVAIGEERARVVEQPLRDVGRCGERAGGAVGVAFGRRARAGGAPSEREPVSTSTLGKPSIVGDVADGRDVRRSREMPVRA